MSQLFISHFCVFLLAESARSLGSVFIFDLDAVRAWLERYVHGARTGLPLPPCRELRCLEGGSCGFSDNLGRIVLNHNSAFCFLDNGNHAILSGGSALFCWYTGGGNWVPGVINLLWKFQYKDTITSMSVLTADTIVLGSSTGLLAILNWKKVVRASFSCKPSPTLVEDWVSFSAGPLQEQFDTPSPTAAMGILKIHVIAESTIPGEISLYRLVCVTSCGWVLSSVIEALSPCTDSKLACASEIRIRRRKGCELHHSTKPIKWKEIGGDVVSLKTRTWVVPTKRIQVHNTEMALIWQKVEDDTVHVLPHPDQRVLASAPSLAMPRCMNSTLEWMATSYSSCGVGSERYHLRTIPIPKNAGPLTCIAVHPDQEWILVGTSQTGISLINARSNIF